LKVLWYSNPSWTNSGYGIATKHVLRGLRERGFGVGLAPNYGFGTGALEVDGYPVHFMGPDFSEEAAVDHYLKHGYDALVTLYDVWPLRRLSELVRARRVVWVPWAPIDHDALYPAVGERLESAFHVAAMSKYGKAVLDRAGFTDSSYIPLGVDCGVFRPVDLPKGELRGKLGFPEDSFVVAIVKMNKGLRGMIPEQLEGIKLFAEANPDVRVRAYVHAMPNTRDGFNLVEVLRALGIGELVRFPEPYAYLHGFSPIQMAKVYNCSDVLLNATSSEGFGMPIVEAHACGIPAVAGDYTAMRELLSPTPELRVRPRAKIWFQVPARYFVPDPEDIADKLERVLNSDPNRYGRILPEHARRNYDWNGVVVPRWAELLRSLEARIEERCVRIPGPSGELRAKAQQVEVVG